MKIVDLLNPAAIAADLQAAGKSEALAELTDVVLKVESGLDREEGIHVLQVV